MSTVTAAWFAGVVAVIVALTVVFGLKFLGGVILLLVALYWLAKRLFTDDRRPDEVHYVKTDDGWDLAVWRIKPATQPARAVPILMQHGLGFNQRNFDLDDRYSLARYLARQGYDCFIPALRGCGPSAYHGRRRGKWDIDFDQFVESDLPAAFALVRRLTGAPKLHFIGMSMGGMIGYAIAEGELSKAMQSFTSICGPCFFKHMSQFKPLLRFRSLLNRIAVIRQAPIMKTQAHFFRLWPRLAGNEEVNSANVDGDVLARATVNGIENMPSLLMKQFAEWVEKGDFGSHLGAESWERRLDRITTPIYCLAGSADRFCVPAAIEDVVNRVSSPKKRYRLFSKAVGGQADYGHGDIIVGRTAPEEVFPTILEWLNENEDH